MRDRPNPPQGTPAGTRQVVIITASVGAGHDGAAREWADRLRADGFDVDVHDLLDLMPGWASRLLTDAYQQALHRAPWIWSTVYHLTRTGPATRLVAALAGRYRSRLLAVLPAGAALVLTTHPLAAQILGRIRRRGELACPVATFVTDFSVAPLWVARGVDATYVVHPAAGRQAGALGAPAVEVTGPLVPARFRPASPAGRERARAAFGLPAQARIAVVVAGSWGVGDVERTAREIEATGLARPVVVCGHNTELQQRLARAGVGIPLGWVSEMDELLRAADVLVENAGGLSSLEAMACGVPVVTYRAIPGHGQANAAALAAAGVSLWARDPRQLGQALHAVFGTAAGSDLRDGGLAVFTADPVKPARDLAGSPG